MNTEIVNCLHAYMASLPAPTDRALGRAAGQLLSYVRDSDNLAQVCRDLRGFAHLCDLICMTLTEAQEDGGGAQ